ncbi:alpha/beta fold hydrolase, partial [Acinetobacter baumannii]
MAMAAAQASPAAKAKAAATAPAPVPTLLIAGALDTDTPPTEARALLQRHPGATLVLLPEAGHMGMLEQPAAFQATVLP